LIFIQLILHANSWLLSVKKGDVQVFAQFFSDIVQLCKYIPVGSIAICKAH